MKDIYKQQVDNKIDAMITRVNHVNQMVKGDRPADSKQADIYLQEVLRGLEQVREVIVRG